MPRKTILIADDEPHVTFMVSMKLKHADATVLVASDGEEAFQLALEHRPDLVITDFQMPRMSGYDLALRMRQTLETTNIPLLMLTARGHRLTPTDLAKTNIQCLIAKPFSVRELLSKVSEFVELKLEQDEAGTPAA